jgi:hypothetical protein
MICQIYIDEPDEIDVNYFVALQKFSTLLNYIRPRLVSGDTMSQFDRTMQKEKEGWTTFVRTICIKSDLFVPGKEKCFEKNSDVNFKDVVNQLSKSIFNSVFHGLESIKFNEETVTLITVESNFSYNYYY